VAYSIPTTASGQVLTSAIWNASVRDNIIYLNDRVNNPPAVRVTNSGTQSIATATATALTFNTQNDVKGAAIHSTGTNPNRLTVPTSEDGYYLIVAFVEFAANATGQRTVAIRLNGATTLAATTVDAAAAGATQLTVSLLWPAVATNYFEVVVTQNSGGNLNVAATPRVEIARVN
jgi:phosphatidate phosphatase APP1